jgi:hypothetical protein
MKITSLKRELAVEVVLVRSFLSPSDEVGTSNAECSIGRVFSPQGRLGGYIELSGME